MAARERIRARQRDRATEVGPGALVDQLQSHHQCGDTEHSERDEHRVLPARSAPEDDHSGPCDNDRAHDTAKPGEETRTPLDAARDVVSDPARDVIVDRHDLTTADERRSKQGEAEDADGRKHRLDGQSRPQADNLSLGVRRR